MEILFLISILIYLKIVGNNMTVIKTEKLPIKGNPKGYFDDKAFTEIYYQVNAKSK